MMVVSIKRQKVRVYDANGEIASSRISSGRPGFNTPTGVFSILEKNVYHTSNIYSGASMPYQERITWSGHSVSCGDIPGFPASHGCIRLPFAFSKKLYGLTKLGTRVVVTSEEVEPIAFESPKLFKPLPVDEASAMKSDRSKPAQLAVNDQADDNSTSDALQELPLFIGVSPALIRAVADMPRDPQRRPTTRAEADQIMQEKLDRARASLKTAQAAARSSARTGDSHGEGLRQLEPAVRDGAAFGRADQGNPQGCRSATAGRHEGVRGVYVGAAASRQRCGRYAGLWRPPMQTARMIAKVRSRTRCSI